MEAARVPQDEIATRVAVRMGRRDILTRRDPAHFTAFIGECVFHQRIGPREVMVEQLEHLWVMAARPNVDIRVVPTATGWHPGLDGQFMLLTSDGMSLVHIENQFSAVFVQEDDVVARVNGCVPELLDVAMGRDESADLIAKEAGITGVL
jgi:hypothetical protein